MTNLRNYGMVTGRLTRDVAAFTNKDGSRKIMVNVAVQNNYTNKEGKKDSQYVALEGFIRADKQGNGVFDHMHRGDLVSIGFSVRSNNYVDKTTNKTVYSQVLFIENVDLLESKSVTDARQTKNASQSAGNAAPAPAQESNDGYETVADVIDTEDLPFN